MHDYEPIQHLSLENGPHPEDWRGGYSCPECADYMRRVIERNTNQAPRTNLSRIAAEREGHYSQAEMARDIFDSARAEGREIQRAGRSWT